MFRFSNWGAPYRGHGIVAPGGDTWAARPGGGTVQHKGTSVAAPIVAGVAALLASLRRQRGLPADLVTVRDALLASARPCTPAQSHGHPDRCLAGSLNVPGATRLALAGAPAVEVSAVPRMSSVYTIGRLGYDFGTDTRRDAFAGRMAPAQPTDPRQMAGYLTANPSMATELIWTVLADDGPIYAVEPAGAYADELYELLRQLFVGQLAARHDDEFVERISVPGRLDGRTTRLLSDQIVPVVEVREKRGMYGWTVDRLVADTIATLPSPVDPRVQRSLRDFLVRSYDELRSRGAESRDRALNFAATNPVQAARALAAAVAADLTLDTIAVEKSPFCRLGSDCQEIKLRCHDPEDDDRAVRVWRFTIDVSDVLPVTLGEVRAWAEI
jgi:cyanobactin maturation PatA/PatG family protease